jgi:hypothetical protein
MPAMLDPLDNPLHLKEPPQPPDLEDGLSNHDTDDKQIPPLDPIVGALSCVAVGAFADDNVGLLILDLGKQLRQLPDLDLEGILWAVAFRDIDDTVDIEGNLFAVGTPVLVAEAVGVLAVVLGLEGEVAGRDGLFVDLVLGNRVGDLLRISNLSSLNRQRLVGAHTQKSMSRLPELPNSRSPTWNVTVILSSRCRFSWKHSRPCAGS